MQNNTADLRKILRDFWMEMASSAEQPELVRGLDAFFIYHKAIKRILKLTALESGREENNAEH